MIVFAFPYELLAFPLCSVLVTVENSNTAVEIEFIETVSMKNLLNSQKYTL